MAAARTRESSEFSAEDVNDQAVQTLVERGIFPRQRGARVAICSLAP